MGRAWNTVCYERIGSADRAAYWCVYHALHPVQIVGLEATFANLVRDVFGNPFRAVAIEPEWLTLADRMVPKLTTAIYEDRAFERMPILGDALEEAGGTNQDILEHCHLPGQHVKGCWIVDLVRGCSGVPALRRSSAFRRFLPPLPPPEGGTPTKTA